MMKIKKIILYIITIVLLMSISHKLLKPVIKLNGKQIITIKLNEDYKEYGYKIDNGSNVVTIDNNVDNTKVGVYDVIYKMNYNKNEIQTIRKVRVIDDIKPIIELNGYMEEYILLDSLYEEAGYKATDNYDGDITKSVKVTSNIRNEIGKYEITYKVSDSSGNIYSITRKINVVENNNGIIYLTFDDGPSIITTKILDILKEYNIKATFFIVGFNNDMNSTIRRMNEEGHTIALHSWSHYYRKIYESEDSYYEDLLMLQNKVKELTGIESKIIRFPGGSSNTVSFFNRGIMTRLTKDVITKGYHYFDWNVSSKDVVGANDSTDVYNNVISNLSKNRSNVVLMHDHAYSTKTLYALENIIKECLKNGYTFSNITYNTPMIQHYINN